MPESPEVPTRSRRQNLGVRLRAEPVQQPGGADSWLYKRVFSELNVGMELTVAQLMVLKQLRKTH